METAKFKLVALLVAILGVTTLLVTACSNNSPSSSNSPTATPTPASSSAGKQLYIFAVENSNAGTTIVGIQGPIANTGGSFSFSLPTASAGVTYYLDEYFDTAVGLTVPSSAQTIC